MLCTYLWLRYLDEGVLGDCCDYVLDDLLSGSWEFFSGVYFTRNYGHIKQFWDDVLKYREIGLDTLKQIKKAKYKPYKERELNFLD